MDQEGIVRGEVAPGGKIEREEDMWRVGTVKMKTEGRCWCQGELEGNWVPEQRGQPQTLVLLQCVQVNVEVGAIQFYVHTAITVPPPP